jgi:hypothetical protein
VEWSNRAACVRWETLQERPLELRWEWAFKPRAESQVQAEKLLDEAWKRAVKTMTDAAREGAADLAWRGEAEGLERWVNRRDGYPRLLGRGCTFSWNGRWGVLAVMRLEIEDARLWLAAVIRPSATVEAPEEATGKIIRSIAIRTAKEPLAFRAFGLDVIWPADLRLHSLRGKDSHVLLEARGPGRRLGLARSAPQELLLYHTKEYVPYQTMARMLFQRGNAPEPTEVEFLGRRAFRFEEARRVHVRVGDALVRPLGRAYLGRSVAYGWACPKTHSLWTIFAQCGMEDPDREIQNLVAGLDLCGEASAAPFREDLPTLPMSFPLCKLNWRPFIEHEVKMGYAAESPAPEPRNDSPAKKTLLQKVFRTNATGVPDLKAESRKQAQERTLQRARQLAFRLHKHKDVVLEPDARGDGGVLVFQAAPPKGVMARLVLGKQKTTGAQLRRITVDPVGRFIWEHLRDDPSAGDLIVELSNAFSLHPVMMFPILMRFVNTLSERRMIGPSPKNDKRLFGMEK